jgi:ribonuclease HI
VPPLPLLSVYCDGAAHAKQGWPGGWAFVVLRAGAVLCTQTGAAPRTSNNLMELEAALRGLQAVLSAGWHLGAAVELVSDSRVALDAAAGLGAPRHARALAAELREACLSANAQVRWVRGHAGDAWNTHVDALARQACLRLVPARVKRRAAARAQRRG